MEKRTGDYKNLPGVDNLLNTPEIKTLVAENNSGLVKYAINQVLGFHRNQIAAKGIAPSLATIIEQIKLETDKLKEKNLRPVINATGVIIHTNLGRAPFGKETLEDVLQILEGYNNLEFDLVNATRGTRYSHLSELLKYLTGAEAVLIVNNNAAAVMLSLRTFAKNREVIVSRGELIEIGGSFRLPEILEASDCIMKEVGTTNKTNERDYQNAINEHTALLLKVHKSNYVIKGFTHEVNLSALVKIGKKHSVPVIYDMGSGLLKKASIEFLHDEPDVKQTLATGVDLVCFSGDKLLGGPQAGIIAGKKEMILRLKKEPMLRALRVSKTTLALLESACLNYLDENQLLEKNLVFRMLKKTPEELREKANLLQKEFKKYDIESTVVTNKGHCGGGALPEKEINTWAVLIEKKGVSGKKRSEFSEQMFHALLNHDRPVLGILKRGLLYFDVLTIASNEIPEVANTIHDVYKKTSL
ncbi:MAG: L-seryl-tRNA(Sec) selenium transferase [Bacteroidales bacterium]|nr:L-seryl-tRNA(Sec) selenium transferase [Bacteroidales bacterium]